MGKELLDFPTLKALEKLKLDVEDEQTGVNIVKKALETPIRQLITNAGLDASIIVNRIKEAKETEGFDVEKSEYGDMFQKGIIDPTKVTRSALQNAASIASLLVTTECIITEKPEKEEKGPEGMPGGGGYPPY